MPTNSATPRSASYLLTEDRLGSDLDAFVRAARCDGATWRSITDQLVERTSVKLNAETVRSWFPQYRDVIALLKGEVA